MMLLKDLNENFRSVKWNRSALAFGILGSYGCRFWRGIEKPSFSSMEQIFARVRRGAWH